MAIKATPFIAALCLGTALAGTPALAEVQSQSAREAAMEARLQQLEAAVAQLQGELRQARSAAPAPAQGPTKGNGTAAMASTPKTLPATPGAAPGWATGVETADTSVDTERRLAALEKDAATDGFKVGNTRFKLGGFLRVNALATRFNDGELPVGALGNEFYLPQQIPVGEGFSSQSFLIQARQSRFVVTSATPVGDNMLKSLVEIDFAISTAPAGAQRATNAFVPNLRRAFLTYGNLLVGQEWTTFQNVSVLPESTDFVGPLEGTVFVRQAMVQYKFPLSKSVDLFVALENPETELVTPTSPALIDVDDDAVPDLTAKLAARTGIGEFTLAGIVRQLRVDSKGDGGSTVGWGLSAAGRVIISKLSDLRFMASYGNGIGRYLGLGYAPDAVLTDPRTGDLANVGNFAAFAALKLGWTPTLRSTVMGGYQSADYGDQSVAAFTNEQAWSIAGNLFWTPMKNFDVGIEYRHAVRSVFSGESGSMDRLEAAFKYSY